MGAVVFPRTSPPVVTPGGWDPTREAPGRLPGEMPSDTIDGPTLGQVWNKIKEAVGVKPDARVEPRVEAQQADCSQTSNQNDCNACKLRQGFMVPAKYTIPESQYRSYDYQLRIANHLASPERFDYTYGGTTLDRARAKITGQKNEIFITEWMHGNIRFDGYWRGQCTVVEAKAYYKQFFDGKGGLKFWAKLNKESTILDDWFKQASTQFSHVSRQGEPAKLEWHFLEPECFAAASKHFGLISSICRYSP